MARHEEQWEADEERFEREEERTAEQRQLLHDHPSYSFRTDERTFPCGLDAGTPGERIAWDLDDISCPGCVEAREQRAADIAASTARNAEWLSRQPYSDGHRFAVGPDGELLDTYAAGSAPVIKRCGCGRGYTAAAWAELPLVGHQQNEGETVALEMRNCPCGSTICVEVPARPDVRTVGVAS